MRAMDGLTQPQRLVIIIALGLALAVVGSFVTSLGGGVTGWYAYSPLTSASYVPGHGLPSWLRLFIWLALIAIWAVASIQLLKPSPAKST
jgi:heme/copper-type cytochrome/quinol oxidase subunit 1